jgi:hypothetical protein
MTGLTKRRVLYGALAIFAAWFALETYLAGREYVPPFAATQPITLQSGAARGERITTHSWSIAYDKITTNADQTFVDVEGVHSGLIYRKGKPWLRVRARHMSINMLTHDFTASGPLHVETVDRGKPRSFDTTSAIWSETQQQLTFNEPSTLTTRGGKLRIDRMSLEVKSGKVHLERVSGGMHD